MVLINRKMILLVEGLGEQSEELAVHYAVTQGTVKGPFLFLFHINNYPDTANGEGLVALKRLLAEH